jgi:hypothetical protein
MMGNVGFFALRDLGIALRNRFDITTFIETGTYKAQTTQWAANEFKKVITIEAHQEFYNRAVRLFKGKKNVRCIFGDSLVEFPKAIKRLRKPALIWLDAHKCRFEDSLTASECPLIDELKAITATGINHFVLIDDARMYIEQPPKPYDPTLWPTFDEIKALLPQDYFITIWQDAIIAVPPEAAEIVKRFSVTSELEITVLTSNDYVHCLPAFGYLFNKFWDAGQAVKIVRYDVRPAKMSGNFTNFAIGNQADYTWSSGLLKYLHYHTDDLILLMLEDYFIDKPVAQKRIKQLWQYMKTHPEIAKIDLSDDRLKVAHSDYENGMIKSNDSAVFQTSLQAAIWRKECLIRFLNATENAWQFEKNGTKRIIKARKAGTFDGIILGCLEPPLSYVNAKGGEGTQPEKWDFKKMPVWMINELRSKRLLNG